MNIEKVSEILAGSRAVTATLFFYERDRNESLFAEFVRSKWCANANGYYFGLSKDYRIDLEAME